MVWRYIVWTLLYEKRAYHQIHNGYVTLSVYSTTQTNSRRASAVGNPSMTMTDPPHFSEWLPDVSTTFAYGHQQTADRIRTRQRITRFCNQVCPSSCVDVANVDEDDDDC